MNGFTREVPHQVVAFIASLLILALLVLPVFPYSKRRAVGTPLTWGQAMLAGTYAFFGMYWAYAIVPHLWLTWADNELKWRPDALLYQYWDVAVIRDVFKPQAKGGPFPVTITMQTLRDFLVVGIYVVFLGLQIWLWAYWQKRGQKPVTDIATSDYGRPLVRKG